MAYNREQIPHDERPAFGQSVPLGDTGDGNTSVPAEQQGISNRPGDQAGGMAAQEEEDEEFSEEEDDPEEDDPDEDDLEEDDLEDDEDDVSDPQSEPGKPV